MAIRTIYFDESGFTGCDLLNPEQPIFCVASSDIGEQMADEILKTCFPRYQGPEIKFGNIWSRWGNRKGLLRFAESIAKNNQNLFAYWIDKKFCTLTKFVDFLIEPILHDLAMISMLVATHQPSATGLNLAWIISASPSFMKVRFRTISVSLEIQPKRRCPT